jgi:glycosyltransferase involved in cell wall biosynthesis
MTGPRVVIDATAVPAYPSGAGRYVLELVSGLGERDDVSLGVVCRRDDRERWKWLAPTGEIAAHAPRRRPLRLGWEQLAMGRVARRLGADVYHGPHYTMPRRVGAPVVVTVHDLTFFDNPEWHESAKAQFFRRATRVAAEKAAALVCVSRATAERLDAILEPRVPVHVIPHGVDHDRYRADGDVLDPETTPPFVFFVGTLEPRKDVPTLVAAFDAIASSYPDLRLRIAGHPGWGTREVEAAVGGARHGDRVDLAGYVAEQDVPTLLRSAAAVAYPSLAEGFGLPALEAMACGAPLVTTTGSAMEEVVGDAALLVPPSSPGDLAAALRSILDDPAATAARRQKGLEVARRYTWEASVAAHVEVYRGLAGA